ncbi:hypothetical protein OEA41_007849 [Lepraria neglecta]|uniref:Uncharacterized protein n=1 Tax=Lepraria neglecta TaxID=209136 RepID=A0AAD9ZDU3_9LECA|nr:hypothetical protein OEA41_007849 [Lepraria neglecta]
METEEATKPASADNEKVTSSTDTKDAIEKLMEESKPAEQTNGTKETTNEEVSKKEDTEDKSKEFKDEKSGQDQPSKRVQEGQKWNERPRNTDRPYNKYGNKPFKRNNKSDLTSQEESSDPVAIRKQVEFYFSDSNLLQDKFLFTKVEGHKNLPVPISVIHSFKRMRHFQPLSAIVDALKESTTLDVVEDDTCIQRKEPLPEGLEGKPMVEIEKVYEDKSMARSVYAKGFGEEQPSTQFDIEAFFAQYGPTNSVRLRRTHDQTFKGSVFVEFDSEDTQKAFLALDPKPKWKENELQVKSKKQYCDDKVDDIAAGRVRPNEDDRSRQNKNGHGSYKRRRDSPDYDKGRQNDERDDRDWRVRRDEDHKSGFKDRNDGKHRDSGRGRGRGGGRGGRGGDRNRSRDRNRDRTARDARGVPIVRTSTPDTDDEVSPHTSTAEQNPIKEKVSSKTEDNVSKPSENGEKTADKSMAPPAATVDIKEETPSKKRAREENDDGAEEQGAVKKVDVKGES